MPRLNSAPNQNIIFFIIENNSFRVPIASNFIYIGPLDMLTAVRARYFDLVCPNWYQNEVLVGPKNITNYEYYEEYIPQSPFESPENVHQERDYDAVAVTADT